VLITYIHHKHHYSVDRGSPMLRRDWQSSSLRPQTFTIGLKQEAQLRGETARQQCISFCWFIYFGVSNRKSSVELFYTI